MRDALGEFISHRAPVRQYVNQRYADQGEQFRDRKFDEVSTRIVWASMIKSGILRLEK